MNKKMIDNVEKMAKSGMCDFNTLCIYCPFDSILNNGLNCVDSGFSGSSKKNQKDNRLIKSSKAWLLEHKEDIEKINSPIENNKFETVVVPRKEYNELLEMKRKLIEMCEGLK